MKKSLILSISMMVLLTATFPLMGQVPDGSRIFAYPPIRISDLPQDPSTPHGILPVQFKAAYGFNQVPSQGQGQTIALVDAYDDPNIVADLAAYASYFHIAPCNFQKVKVGNPPGDSGWGLEISLDVEQACALAPQANIILVEANSSSFNDLLAAVHVAVTAPYNATVVSMSWGGGEFNGEQAFDASFCNIVNGNGQPVTFLASSGDGGHGVIYPSASPCVIAVGGTSLVLSTPLPLPNPLQLNYGIESAWNGSGGGVSTYETQMSWQNPACATWSTTKRCVPDIASDANPSTGVPVYDTYGYGGWVEVGGTSVSSPDWGAFITLVNAVRASNGKGTLSQAAYDLYQFFYSTNYLIDFHDITSGTNGSCGSQCTAATSYDLVTGIGSYQANKLVSALLAATN